MASYCVLMADLIASREYDEEKRKQTQQNLDWIIQTLNEIYQHQLAKPVMFSGGDEVQGLFLKSSDAYEYARLLELLMFPAKIRIGLGIGEWSLRLDDEQSTKQDGPAYHLARKAVEELKLQRSAPTIRFCCAARHGEEVLNGFYGMLHALEEKQSKGQRKIFIIGRVLFGTMFYQGVEISVHRQEYLHRISWLLKLAKALNHPCLKDIQDIEPKQNRFRIRKWMAQETKTSEQNISKQMKMGTCDEIIQGERALLILLKHENEKGEEV